LQLLLAILGVALGVAVFVGVELANDSARRAFAESQAQLAGQATHQLVGIGEEIPSELYRELRTAHGAIAAAPIVETRARVAGTEGRSFALLGIDPLEEIEFRSYSGFSIEGQSDTARLIAEPRSLLVPSSLAAELGLDIGSVLDLVIERRAPVTMSVIGIFGGQGVDATGINLPLLADIATVQELRGRDSITRIDLRLTPAEAEALERIDLPGVTLVPSLSRSLVFNELSRAFRVNLTALSLLALLVGVFLIYATISFAVLQRRKVFGIYRALGVRRSQLLLSILAEAFALGSVATLLGIALGYGLSQALVELVLRTIGDLYFSTAVRAAAPSPGLYAEGLAVGIGTSLLAASLPALEAARAPPRTAMSRAALERTASRISRLGGALAIPILAAGVLTLSLAPRSLIGAFAGLFLVILAAALAIPLCAALLLRLAEPILDAGFGVPGSLAARGVTASLSRTGVATAALAVAVATVIGVGLMIASFRGSVERWLDSTLLGDFYAEVEDWAVSADDPFADTDLASIAAIPGVRGLSLLQFTRLPTEAGEINVRAILPGPDGWGLTMTDSVGPDALDRLAAGTGIFVSEAMAYRRVLSVGDELALPTQEGVHSFSVLGIYREYNTDGGGILLPMREYQAYWPDRDLEGLGIYVEHSADLAATRAAVEMQLDRRPGAVLRSTRSIRDRSLEIFDRTFQITEVLRILAGAVAFLGLLSALLAIELDRGKEIAILRALGFTPRQIGTLSLTQTVLLGTVAGLLAMPLGIAMAGLLVKVINQRSFGWGMDLALQFGPLALGMALAVAAAFLAGIYPALRLSRHSVVARLREE
jgi:putative ABC transport system permease protein